MWPGATAPLNHLGGRHWNKLLASWNIYNKNLFTLNKLITKTFYKNIKQVAMVGNTMKSIYCMKVVNFNQTNSLFAENNKDKINDTVIVKRIISKIENKIYLLEQNLIIVWELTSSEVCKLFYLFLDSIDLENNQKSTGKV